MNNFLRVTAQMYRFGLAKNYTCLQDVTYNVQKIKLNMSVFPKTNLINLLKLYEDAFLLHWCMPDLIPQNEWQKFSLGINKMTVPKQNGQIIIAEATAIGNYMLENHRPTLNELYKYAKRCVMKESFELIMLFAHQTQQVDVFKSSNFYPLMRIARNASSHSDGGTIEWPKDFVKKGIITIEHKEIKFDINQVGDELDIRAGELLELLQDVRQWCNDNFK